MATIVVSIIAVVVIARSLRRDGPAALEAWRAAQIQWSWIAIALAAALSAHALYVFGWRRLLHDAGVAASYLHLARLFLVSNLGRYLPGGKAWQMAIIGAMAQEHALPPARVATSSLFQGSVGMGVGTLVLFALGGATLGFSPVWLALPVAGIIGLLALPTIIRAVPRLHAVAGQRLGLDTVTVGTMWALVWTAAASWMLWGLALYALGRGVLPHSAVSVATYILAWTASFLAGILAFVVPAGLGAREEVMDVVLAGGGMAAHEVLIILVLARVSVTLLDVVPAVLMLAWRQRRRAPSQAIR